MQLPSGINLCLRHFEWRPLETSAANGVLLDENDDDKTNRDRADLIPGDSIVILGSSKEMEFLSSIT